MVSESLLKKHSTRTLVMAAGCSASAPAQTKVSVLEQGTASYAHQNFLDKGKTCQNKLVQANRTLTTAD